MRTSLARMPTLRFWVALLVTLGHYSGAALAAVDSDVPTHPPATSSATSATDVHDIPSDPTSDEESSPLDKKPPSPDGPQSQRGTSGGEAPPTGSPVPRRAAGDQATGFAKRTIGPLGIMTVDGPEGVHAGGALHVRGVALLFGPTVSARYLESHWIGYDTFGTTYSLSAQMGIGARWELSNNHGPFVRADLRGEIARMGGFRYSSLRLPGVQLGYGLDQGKWILDAFGHAGPSLTGRVRHPGFTQPVKGAFIGGAFSLGYDNWLLHTDVSQLLHFGGIFRDVRSSLCSYWGRKPTLLVRTRKVAENVGPRSTDYSVGFCTDFGSLTFQRSDQTIQKTDIGLSIVFGSFSRLDHAGRP